jgi:hypothetical protein
MSVVLSSSDTGFVRDTLATGSEALSKTMVALRSIVDATENLIENCVSLRVLKLRAGLQRLNYIYLVTKLTYIIYLRVSACLETASRDYSA